MQQFFEQVFQHPLYEVSLYEWGLLAAIWAGAAVALLTLVQLAVWWVGRLAEQTTNKADDLAVEMLRQTRSYFLIVLGLGIASKFIALPSVWHDWIGRIVFLLFLIQIVQWGGSAITMWIEGYKQARLEEDATAVTTVQAAGFIGRLVLLTVAVLLALDNFGMDVTTLIAGLGVGGIAVGLALQNVLGDLFASLSIVIDKPFVVGDFLIIDDFLGSVEHVGLKTTRLRSLGGEQIVFSNSDLLASRIRNYKRMSERRVVFSIQVAYQTPYHQIKRISDVLRKCVEEQDEIRFDRAHFKAYGDYALIYEIVYYVLAPDYNIYMDKQQAINLAIHRRFEEMGVEFAYPTRTAYVREGAQRPGVPVRERDDTPDTEVV